MKNSLRYGLISAGWTLLQLLFVGLLFYALTGGNFWLSLLCVLILFLSGNSASQAQVYMSLSRQHKARETMEDLKE